MTDHDGGPCRLPAGGRVDHDQPLTFRFNGRSLPGLQGDTLASALLANDVRIVGRSFKYHRPRGIVGSGAEEPNAILQIGTGATTLPDQRATQVALYQGLEARTINCWPGPGFDLMAVTGWFSRLLPAGFYYKTFMWPRSFWPRYEARIRNAAGLGLAPLQPDPDRYDKINNHCDVLVVGAGPAGLAAAVAAGRSGARVMLVDEQEEPGGSLLAGQGLIESAPSAEWLQQMLAELAAMPEVRVLPRATAFGYYDHNFLAVAERLTDHLPAGAGSGPRQRLWRIRAAQVVLATGAIERPLVFANNDRPGVMLASAVSTYVNRYAVVPGQQAVVFTNNDSAYQTVLDLLAVGVSVNAAVDVRPEPAGTLVDRVRAAGVAVLGGQAVVDAQGGRRLEGVRLMKLSADGRQLRGGLHGIVCDLLAMSGGWSPVVHLHAQSGGRPRFDEQQACFVPGVSVQRECSAGSGNGTWTLRDCVDEGFQAGLTAATDAGCRAAPGWRPALAEPTVGQPLMPCWRVPVPQVGHGGKQFVDYQNDTTAADIALAAREGYRSIEHVKRYTALGFGTDQGKLGNINGMAILAETLGQDLASTGTTTFRPAYTPTTFATIAGRDTGSLFDPVRRTAIHDWHVSQGAEFENVGQWKRPWYYPRGDETLEQAVARECLATRNSVGIMDATTLGKIDVRGPDAAEFLNRVYTNGWKKLAVGRCRYGLMLGEDGMIMDDGVTARLAEDRYHMTTTTGGAASVMAWLERWLQTEWPDLQVYLTSVTDQWAAIGVAGPHSREVVAEVCDGIDFDAEAFPFMSWRDGLAAKVPARVFRISFSGELCYEVNVPADCGRAVWDALVVAGERFHITPYGTETMHVLRAEKGFIIVGQDTDGSMTPADMGMDGMVSGAKDFLGKRSLSRSDCLREDRKQLVGLRTLKPEVILPEGAQLVNDPEVPVPVPMVGHVTSSYYSACLGRSIALAVVKGGRARVGERVYAPLPDGRIMPAEICAPVFYDPDGARQNG